LSNDCYDHYVYNDRCDENGHNNNDDDDDDNDDDNNDNDNKLK
jgi:hypothetical protein